MANYFGTELCAPPVNRCASAIQTLNTLTKGCSWKSAWPTPANVAYSSTNLGELVWHDLPVLSLDLTPVFDKSCGDFFKKSLSWEKGWSAKPNCWFIGLVYVQRMCPSFTATRSWMRRTVMFLFLLEIDVEKSTGCVWFGAAPSACLKTSLAECDERFRFPLQHALDQIRTPVGIHVSAPFKCKGNASKNRLCTLLTWISFFLLLRVN